MEETEILKNLPVYSKNYWALLAAATCILSIVFFSFRNPKRQITLQNVPVVGVERTKSIKQAREEFRHGSKNMLLEGYRKVYLFVLILAPANG